MAESKAQIVVDGDVSPLRQKLRAAANDLKKFGDDGASAVERIGAPLAALQSKFIALGALIGGGAVFKSAISEAAAFTEQSIQMGRALGISATEAGKLKLVLDDNETSIDEFVGTAQKLLRQVNKNEEGINKMGLATRDSTGHLRPLNEMMLDALDVLNGYKAGTDRAVAGQAMFGKGTDITTNLLKLNKKETQETIEFAEKLGLVVGGESVAAFGNYDDAMDKTHLVMMAVKNTIGNALMPVVSSLGEWFSSKAPSAMQRFAGVMADVGSAVMTAGGFLLEHIGAVATVTKAYIGLKITSFVSSFVLGAQAAATAMLSHVASSNAMGVANLQSAQSFAAHTGALAAHANMLLADARASVAAAGGMARLSVVQNTLIPAQLRAAAAAEAHAVAQTALATATTAASVAGRAAGGMLAFLGGPLGAVITLLGLAATAWFTFGSSAKTNVNKAAESVADLQNRLDNLGKEKKFGVGQLGKDRETLAKLSKDYADLLQKPLGGGLEGPMRAYREKEKQAILDQIALYSKLIIAQEAIAQPAATVPPGKTAEELLGGDKQKTPKAGKEFNEEDYRQDLMRNANAQADKELEALRRAAEKELEIRRKVVQQTLQIKLLQADGLRSAEMARIDELAANSQYEVELGQITQAQHLANMAVFNQQRLAAEQTFIDQKKELALQDPDQNPVELERIELEKQEIRRRYAAEGMDIQRQQSLESQGIWQELTDTISGLWDKGIQALMNGTLTWSNAMRAIGADITQWFVTNVVGKMVKEFLAGEAAKFAGKMGWIALEKALMAASTTATIATKGTETTAVAGMNAVQAGTGAAASQASIPWIGPILAIAAMGAIFAAVSAMGKKRSAAGGFDIPKGLNPMTQLHEEEMVLPKKYANVIRGMTGRDQAAGEGGGGQPMVVNISATDARGVRDLLLNNQQALVEALKAAQRNFER